MKYLTCSISGFETFRKEDYLYVDKTEFLWRLIEPAGRSFFLSRPRRFGKSLTISTLMAIFEGKKELFKGLAICDKPCDWKPYPVIHLDMNGWEFSSVEKLENSLRNLMKEAATAHKLTLEPSDASDMFRELIDQLAEKEQVVILIDEYDKPILNNLGKPHVREMLNKLKAFYSVIEKCECKERFVFITGVSKFCHVSLFSEFNKLTDLSMDYDYATIFGYTREELEKYFADRIDQACQRSGKPRAELLSTLEKWYGGYRFHAEAESVYNPISLTRFFSNHCEFNNYWFDVGTPSFLVKLAKQRKFDFERVFNPAQVVAFSACEVDSVDPAVLLLQTGYLTIKRTSQDSGIPQYQLDFPNREVEEAFNTYLKDASTLSYHTANWYM